MGTINIGSSTYGKWDMLCFEGLKKWLAAMQGSKERIGSCLEPSWRLLSLYLSLSLSLSDDLDFSVLSFTVFDAQDNCSESSRCHIINSKSHLFKITYSYTWFFETCVFVKMGQPCFFWWRCSHLFCIECSSSLTNPLFILGLPPWKAWSNIITSFHNLLCGNK